MGIIDKIFGKKKIFKKEGFEQPKDKGNIKKFGDTEYIDSHCTICGGNAKLMVLRPKSTHLQVVLGDSSLFFNRALGLALWCPACEIVVHTSTCARVDDYDAGAIIRCPRCGRDLEPMLI